MTGSQAGPGGGARDDQTRGDDVALGGGERLFRHAVTGVHPRIWLWLILLAAGQFVAFPVALSFVAAVLGALFLLSTVWRVDFYEEEPWRLVERTFLWGAIPAVVLAVIGEVAVGGPIGSLVGDTHRHWIVEVVVAPIVEELCKGAVLVRLFRRRRDEFDGRLDGLLYGALVGIGFAMTENVFYYLEAEGARLHALIVWRGILLGMGHACFSACLGYGLGVASDTTSPSRRRWAPVAGLAAAIGLHMANNLAARLQGVEFLVVVTGFTAVSVFAWFRLAALARAREAHWIEAELADEVRAGVLSRAEAAATRDVKTRKAARSNARLEKTDDRAHALERLYALATELAFAKHKARIDPSHACVDCADALRRAIAQVKSSLALF